MNKKILIFIILSMAAFILAGGIVIFTTINTKDADALSADTTGVINSSSKPTYIPEDKSERDLTYTYIPPTLEDNDPNTKPVNTDGLILEEPFVPATQMDLDPSSITLFVNKEYSIPKDYKPEDLVIPDIYFNMSYYDERTLMRSEAAAAIERLFLAAYNEGYQLSGVSGYRSYARQYKIFTDNIVVKGKEHTLKYSAVPGTSEHQTGLTMDVSCESLGYELSAALSNTSEGKWLAKNAHRFGFIIRYPKGKAKITGYAYEPWHIRYVGKALATYLYENELTLEEYYKYKPSKDFDYEALYADIINYTPSVTPLPGSGDGLVYGENGEIIDEELGEEIEVPVDTGTIEEGNPEDTGTIEEGNPDDTVTDGSDTTEDIPTETPQVTPAGGSNNPPDDTGTITDGNNDTDSEASPGSGDEGSAEGDPTPSPTPTPSDIIPSDSVTPGVTQ